MKRSARNALERRLLILAPIGKDAALIQAMLAEDGVDCLACRDFAHLLDETVHGAAALVLTEEALLEQHGALGRVIAAQPQWSDLPVLLLTRAGANSPIVAAAMQGLGNVTLLERPVRVSALTSAVRTAMRARARQYQIRTHLEERDRADRAKDEFLAMLAHELRNPLAPIRNSLEILRLTNDAKVYPEILATLERQAGHLTRLVDDLMDVSRVTRGKIELRKQPVELAQVIHSAVEISRPLIVEARHRLNLHVPSEPIVVDADPVRLAQVFSNLLNNAVKYSDPGGSIELVARVADDTATVTVTDTGIGIAAEALPRVFDMFYQADQSGRRPLSGLGIGLTLSRSVLKMHGGTISAHSEGLGRGSRFVVTLPVGERKDVPPAEALAPMALSGKPRVLVVDDNRDAADTLARLLEELGAKVRIAHDGTEALAVFDDFRPEAAFLDIGMPGMDGYEVAALIRERHHVADPMLVALTGWGQEQDRRRTRAAGFRHHMVKPASVQNLRAVLATLAH